ncbi:nucleotidyltransferase domain-containing protein [Streptomyces sp. KK5PA1]|uniref:Nucleotidyltransferase domain-containing protein n=2 Tax=Actinacidiphila acididurans TaxID=2784346 RepID=A0ABS2TRW4_9ACTN|nr:nucleotidyltransferase domain-containing protein [Actinacidiphila acididurans]
MRESVEEKLVREHTVLGCVVGLRAYGLGGGEGERRGVYVAPTELFWGLEKPPEQVRGAREGEVVWEVERVCVLGLGAGPGVLECLYSPVVERVEAVGRELLEVRDAFLSRRVRETFREQADRYWGRAEAELRERGVPGWGQGMHHLRLMLECRDLLRTGSLAVDAGPHRERLLAVRRGERTWEEVRAWARTLREEVDAAAGGSPLPTEPDRARVEDFLRRVRRASAVGEPIGAEAVTTAAAARTVSGTGTSAGPGAALVAPAG